MVGSGWTGLLRTIEDSWGNTPTATEESMGALNSRPSLDLAIANQAGAMSAGGRATDPSVSNLDYRPATAAERDSFHGKAQEPWR